MADTITLDGCTLITMDAKDSFYPNARITIKGKRIAQIGLAQDIPLLGQVVNLGGALVMPGLINTHTHSHSSIFRSLADDLELMDWLKKAIWPMEKFLSQERMYAATSLSCLEYLKGGTTTCADQIYYPNTVAKAAMSTGIRSFLAASVFSSQGPAPQTENTFKDACNFVEKWQKSQEETRIYPCIGPHAPYSVDGDLFRQIVRYSEEKDLLIHVHISETADENRQIKETYGMSPSAWLHSLGVFSRPVLAAHSIHLSEPDIGLYQRYGVAASYNPASNLKLVSGIMPLKQLWQSGIVVGIGTDGAQSNNSMDLFRDLRLGSLIQKHHQQDATFANARQMVRMATIEGAKALHFDSEIGSIETGKRADFAILDPTSPRLCPMHSHNLANIYSLISYSALAADVQHVMVDGNWIVRDRRLLTADEDAIRANAQKASEYLLECATSRHCASTE